MSFNWLIYKELNPDLNTMYGKKELLIDHWQQIGKKEGRKHCVQDVTSDFDWINYKKLNPDLVLEYQDDYEFHWVTTGIKQNRLYKVESQLVNNSLVDHMYILYLTDDELQNIKYKFGDIIKKFNYTFFKGVNGYTQLIQQFNIYQNETNIQKIQRAKRNEVQFKKHNMDKIILSVENWQKETHKSRIPTPGAFGNLASVIKIIKDAINHKYKRLLIIEADFYLHKEFINKIADYEKVIKENKIFYLGASQHSWSKKNIFNADINCYKANGTTGLFGVILDQSIYNDYLYLLESFIAPSDVCLIYLQKKMALVAYPNLIICDLCSSNTSNSRLQEVYSKQFRWNLNDYDIKNKYLFCTLDNNNTYKISITANNPDNLFSRPYSSLLINNVEFRNMTSKSKNQLYYFDNIMPKDNKIEIITKNIFLNRIDISK